MDSVFGVILIGWVFLHFFFFHIFLSFGVCSSIGELELAGFWNRMCDCDCDCWLSQCCQKWRFWFCGTEYKTDYVIFELGLCLHSCFFSNFPAFLYVLSSLLNFHLLFICSTTTKFSRSLSGVFRLGKRDVYCSRFRALYLRLVFVFFFF